MAIPIRSRELVILNAPEGWFPRLMKPGMKRSDCPPRSPANPCPYVLCKANLQLVSRHDRPGRYKSGNDDLIRCQSPSCLYDVIDAHPAGLSCNRVAKIMRISTARRAEQIIKRVLEGPLAKINRDD